MDNTTRSIVLESTNASKILKSEVIQPLWSDYGKLLRISLEGSEFKSVILKHIKIPNSNIHKHGLNSDLSKMRKLKSYQVETIWYEKYNKKNLIDNNSLTPKSITTFKKENEYFILLEDLGENGFSNDFDSPTLKEIKLIVSWLASFHAKNIQKAVTDLWQVGTYWHLSTRPEELQRLDDQKLKLYAPLIDKRLSNSNFQTIVHGDAKIANFLINRNSSLVAAVDFQYTGMGPGIKDLAYFLGSCLSEKHCELLRDEILNHYFNSLISKVDLTNIDKNALEKEWRTLYNYAWADFHRFLKGWNPGHWKLNSYSERVTQLTIEHINQELFSDAKDACLEAGSIAMKYYKRKFEVKQKPGNSKASSIVTEVDFLCQKKILEKIKKHSKLFDLGLVSEEIKDDQSRFVKDFFWCIDPLDGTLFFSEGKPGFAISIALISKDGTPIMGVIYNPVTKELVGAIKNHGLILNDQIKEKPNSMSMINMYADQSLKKASNINFLKEHFCIQFSGGAVINSINAIFQKNSCYFKLPKKEIGGCAIWDLAAVAIIAKEAKAKVMTFNGQELNFNPKKSLYFNEQGFIFSNNLETFNSVKNTLNLL